MLNTLALLSSGAVPNPYPGGGIVWWFSGPEGHGNVVTDAKGSIISGVFDIGRGTDLHLRAAFEEYGDAARNLRIFTRVFEVMVSQKTAEHDELLAAQFEWEALLGAYGFSEALRITEERREARATR